MKHLFAFTAWRALALAAVVLTLASVASAGAATLAAGAGVPATATGASAAASAVPAAPAGAATADIRDIRGPKHIPSPWLWPLWLAGGAALAALLYPAWRWNRRRAQVAALLPYEIALARLEAARSLMQPEHAREFSITVSEIVRQFIEARFWVRASRRTTEEFLHDLLEPSDARLTSHRALLADFLQHCDLAKFARWILSFEEMDTMLKSAHTFVLETGRPPASEPKSAAAHPAADSARPAVETVHAHLNRAH
jgi:hypothetical protein